MYTISCSSNLGSLQSYCSANLIPEVTSIFDNSTDNSINVILLSSYTESPQTDSQKLNHANNLTCAYTHCDSILLVLAGSSGAANGGNTGDTAYQTTTVNNILTDTNSYLNEKISEDTHSPFHGNHISSKQQIDRNTMANFTVSYCMECFVYLCFSALLCNKIHELIREHFSCFSLVVYMSSKPLITAAQVACLPN